MTPLASLEDIPRHVAIIMDGNGRWAKKKNRPRVYGHVKGCRRVLEIVRASEGLGIKALTLFAFSTENWNRPKEEVSVLFRLLKRWLIRERNELMERKIRVRAIGSWEKLPKDVREILLDTIEMSSANEGLQLTLALSYGGREEIALVARRLAQQAVKGELEAADIDEKLFAAELGTREVGDPDLVIRTSGEVRVSNFLLWQVAYSELYFSEKMWPDFSKDDLKEALLAYKSRQRRFGKTSEQIPIGIPLQS